VNTTENVQVIHNDKRLKIETEYGRNLQAAIVTYRREKTFLYAQHILTSVFPISQGLGGKPKRICAPLIMFDASIEQEGELFYIRLDQSSARWNVNLLALLINDKDFILSLDGAFEEGNYHDPYWIAENLKAFDDNSVEVIDNLKNVTYLKDIRKNADVNRLTITAGGAMLLAERSKSSRGIIDELNAIAEEGSISTSLEHLLQQEISSSSRPRKCYLDNVPGLLSLAQQKALINAANKDFSLLVGPPGTGKSYTIACMVLESFMQGESVLVVSQNEFAVDVIQEKLVEQLGLSLSAMIRVGSKDYMRYLKQYIDDITKGIGLDEPGKSQQNKLYKLKLEIYKSERRFESFSKSAVTDGIYLDGFVNGGASLNVYSRFKLWLQRRRLKKYGHLLNLLDQVKTLRAEREGKLSEEINHIYLSQLHQVLKSHRKDLMQFNSAIRARTSSVQESRFSSMNHGVLLKALPIWLCSLSSLHRALPLKKQLFDLVIIDEATQCDVASCIPALYRAKRAVIVGDPKQLRHISFLSVKKQLAIQKKNNISESAMDLSYRDKSMVDFSDQAISSQDSIVMLDEHYRSLPEIIDFSNRRFYGNNLRIMTEKPILHSGSPVEIIKIKSGVRKRGVNQVEANAVIARLEKLIAEQEKIPNKYKLSIGVLSFFRDQSEKLQKMIFDKFDLDTITKHKLRAGTPYAFQGEERDIMLISSGVDKDSVGGTYLYLNRPDVFNVALTRARDLQLVFLSVDVDTLPKNNLLRLFVESVENKKTNIHTHILARDKNIEELSEALRQEGMKVIRNYPIAGVPMDLVAMYESHTIAIDVIGFPGEHEDVLHLDRYKIFERAGLKIFPLSYTSWVYEKDKVIEKIKNTFSSLASGSVTKLSIEQISSRWIRLLSISPELAAKVRQLEFDLIDLSQDMALDQLDNIINCYYKLDWVLKQRLSPNELTYSRYKNIAEEVFLGVVNNLRKIVVLSKSLSLDDLSNVNEPLVKKQKNIMEDQQNSVQEIIELNAEAIISLQATTLKWGKVDSNEDLLFEDSLKELDRLSQRIESYSSI